MTINPNHLLLKDALTSYRRALFVTFMFSMVVNILVLAGPLYMLQVFDRVLTSRSTDTLILLTVICVIALLTMALVEMVRSRITVILSAWLDRTLSPALFEGSVYKALGSGATPSTQSLRDMRSMRGFISSPQLFAFFDAPWAPLFIIVMFGLHPYLGVVALGGAILLFAFAVLNEVTTRKPASEDGGASIAAMTIADATARNADAVSAMGMMPAMKMRWREATARSRANQMVAEKRTSVIVASSKFARMALQMMILGTGAWLAVAGEITAGVMIAGSILMSRALAPVEQAIGGWRSMIGAKQAYGRVREHLLTQPVTPESMELPDPIGNLNVSAVSFMADGAREPVLRNVTFSLMAGESLALIGPSGSGKSTLARLLLGNLAPRTGHVRLDGMDVSAWSPDQLGPHCGYLPQDVELFSGTVKDNIARMGEADPTQVVAAAQLAGCHELILALPEGYDTQIGDRGGSLSGGTKQRIGLARAVYGQPKFVVLDEPNSNLDGQGEAALATALTALKENSTTVIIIGHRQSTLELVDKVLMISEGTVQAYGTKQEVSEQLGLSAPGKTAPAIAAKAPVAKTNTLTPSEIKVGQVKTAESAQAKSTPEQVEQPKPANKAVKSSAIPVSSQVNKQNVSPLSKGSVTANPVKPDPAKVIAKKSIAQPYLSPVIKKSVVNKISSNKDSSKSSISTLDQSKTKSETVEPAVKIEKIDINFDDADSIDSLDDLSYRPATKLRSNSE